MAKILVIGDGCIDEFIYCSCDRLSPEAPVPVLDVINKITNLGMAANVAENLKSLGHIPDLITNNTENFTKTRYVEKKTNHIFCRIDSQKTVPRITNLNKINFNKYSAVIISDYNKGFLTEDDINYIGKNHKLTFLDSKTRLGDWAQSVTYIKINEKEYSESQSSIYAWMYNRTIITLGERGARFMGKVYPTKEVEVIDLSGAGDSFLAGLVISYLKTKGDLEKAINFANLCASNAVSQRGVATIKFTNFPQKSS